MPPRPKWPYFALLFAVLGAAGSAYYRSHIGPVPHYAVYLLIVLFSAWSGALLGGVFDWLKYRISPFEPLFRSGFRRYYRLGLWLRFTLVFAGAWLVSAFSALVYVALWSDPEELRAFLSPGGLMAIAALTLIYALIGAVIGGVVSAAFYIFGGNRDGSG